MLYTNTLRDSEVLNKKSKIENSGFSNNEKFESDFENSEKYEDLNVYLSNFEKKEAIGPFYSRDDVDYLNTKNMEESN